MRIIIIPFLLLSIAGAGQFSHSAFRLPENKQDLVKVPVQVAPELNIKIQQKMPWKINRNKILTGGLLFTAGLAKGFNEALQYKYNGFEELFPYANDQWFYPTFSYNNKYKDNDPKKGAKFPLSTSLLVMFTDQYHLNNFVQKSALTAALVLKIGEGKRPFKHYLLDILYYTVCYQVGFHSIFQPISSRN